MRSIICSFLFVALLAAAPVDRVPAPLLPDGEQVDERQRLAQKMKETAQALSQAAMDREDKRDLQFKLDRLIYRLRQTSTPLDQLGLDDIRDLRRKLLLKKREATESLARLQQDRQLRISTMAAMKSLQQGVRKTAGASPDYRDARLLRDTEEKMQRLEQIIQDILQREAKLTKEAEEREIVSGIMTTLVKGFPPVIKRTQELEERERFAPRFLEICKMLGRVDLDDARDAQRKNVKLARQLGDATVPLAQIALKDAQDAQDKFALKEREVSEQLRQADARRRAAYAAAAESKRICQTLRGASTPENAPALRAAEKKARRSEQQARDAEPVVEALRKDLSKWEEVSRIMNALAKDIHQFQEDVQPFKE